MKFALNTLALMLFLNVSCRKDKNNGVDDSSASEAGIKSRSEHREAFFKQLDKQMFSEYNVQGSRTFDAVYSELNGNFSNTVHPFLNHRVSLPFGSESITIKQLLPISTWDTGITASLEQFGTEFLYYSVECLSGPLSSKNKPSFTEAEASIQAQFDECAQYPNARILYEESFYYPFNEADTNRPIVYTAYTGSNNKNGPCLFSFVNGKWQPSKDCKIISNVFINKDIEYSLSLSTQGLSQMGSGSVEFRVGDVKGTFAVQGGDVQPGTMTSSSGKTYPVEFKEAN